MNLHLTFQSSRIPPMRSLSARLFCWALALLWTLLGGHFSLNLRADEVPSVQMLAAAPVCGDGIFLPQIFTSSQPLPVLRLGDAPAFGKTLILTRAQVCGLLAAGAPGVGTNFSGPDAIKISRRSRTFGESDLLGLLTATLQQEYVKGKGVLELRLSQPWHTLELPDEPLTLEVTELPTAGVTPGFMVRFTLRTGNEMLGNWTANVKASVWREVWVASAQLKRGDAVAPELLSRERRDILSVHESLADFAAGNDALEISESVPTGAVLLAHMVKARSVVHRGQRAEALVQDGMMSVRTQVDILEDGAPGDTVRARNVVTHRDLSGTVLNQRTILVSL
jgi:flagella basal body P-ring formation protein FlgA